MKRGRPPNVASPPPVVRVEEDVEQLLLYGHGTLAGGGGGVGNECMLCGKLFSRGVMDLMRHTIAPTLRHLVAKKECAEYPMPCERKCGLWFRNIEEAGSHALSTSCNPDVVKSSPVGPGTPGGLKAGRPKGTQTYIYTNFIHAFIHMYIYILKAYILITHLPITYIYTNIIPSYILIPYILISYIHTYR